MYIAILRIIPVLFALVLAAGCGPKSPDPLAEWQAKEADLGSVKQGTEVVHAFEFTNAGAQPLLIREVKPSCGCTAVEWPRQAIKPGESGQIKVRYRASSKTAGMDLKHVTVLANTKPDFTNLYLKAKVVL